MNTWPKFLACLLGCAVALGLAVFSFILVLDPYQNVPFSPPLARQPVSSNQRFAYPALARDRSFDGLILGTSTARLIDPARLGDALGARFANLAMNSATAYEQTRLFDLFARYHPGLRYFVLGADETWCNRAKRIERYTFRAFPEWMYDDSRYNDLLYLFNDKALENAVRMFELLIGWRAPKYRPDGYSDFTADFPPYDLEAVRKRLYRRGVTTYEYDDMAATRRHPEWQFPLLGDLGQMLDSLPPGTHTVIVLPPLHAAYLARRREHLVECKGRLQDLVASYPEVTILDYMSLSDLTRNDRNYFDPVHFTPPVARRLEADLATRLRAMTVVARRSPASNPAH